MYNSVYKCLIVCSGVGPEGAEPLEWKRPSELVDDPRLFVEGAKNSDINQVPSDFHSLTRQTKLINEKAIKNKNLQWVCS